MLDPETEVARKAWVFVMVLSWSRHLYAEVVFDQRVETWLLCHVHAFTAFGGVPARVVVDNLKSAILHASIHDPIVQRAYRECALHDDFLIDHNPPRTPRLKGKVEQGGVHYLKRNFLAGREPEPLDEVNAALRQWTEQTAGRRIHGTTKQVPWDRFIQVERPALPPLPRDAYDLAIWKQAKLHRDCHLVFKQSFYSAPFRLVGQTLWLRGGTRTVQVYTAAHDLVATHDRAKAPGERQTNLLHLPPAKVPGLVVTRETCQQQAEAIGPATAAVVATLLEHRPVDRLRTADRIVRLRDCYPAERLERACARVQHYGEGDYRTVKRILQEGSDREPIAENAATTSVPSSRASKSGTLPEPRPFTFVRQASEFFASLLGGGR